MSEIKKEEEIMTELREGVKHLLWPEEGLHANPREWASKTSMILAKALSESRQYYEDLEKKLPCPYSRFCLEGKSCFLFHIGGSHD